MGFFPGTSYVCAGVTTAPPPSLVYHDKCYDAYKEKGKTNDPCLQVKVHKENVTAHKPPAAVLGLHDSLAGGDSSPKEDPGQAASGSHSLRWLRCCVS